jgi:hypothetical protein
MSRMTLAPDSAMYQGRQARPGNASGEERHQWCLGVKAHAGVEKRLQA